MPIPSRAELLQWARAYVDTWNAGDRQGWIDNWRRLLDFTLEYHRALTALERAFADLEALVGGALPKSAATDALPAQPEASKSE